MYTFNNDSIITGYIKQLLHSFNLPKCKVFTSEQEAKNYYTNFEGICIIRNFRSKNPALVHIKNNQVISFNSYIYGNYYPNITDNLSLYNNIYDYKSHIYLGNYLRFMRDYNKIDLMSMYNCFSGKTIIDEGYKYLIVPVKYNQEYTVAFNCNSYVYLFTDKITDQDIIDEFEERSATPKYNKISKFSTPYYITSENKKDNKESNYKLVIRVLENDSDNIVVLEGKYKNSDYTRYQFNFDPEVDYDNLDFKTILTNIQLLSDQIELQKYPVCFANKLVEYLTDMCITPIDHISKNIIDAKYKVYERYGNNPDPVTGENNYPHTRAKLGKLNGSFDNDLRIRFIDAFNQTKLTYKNTYDILGYVDKDIEQVIDDETRDIKEGK